MNMGFIYSPLLGVIESKENYASSTPDKAKLEYFKSQEFLIKDRIRKSKENIAKNEKILKKLNDNFSFLYDIFPEEFI